LKDSILWLQLKSRQKPDNNCLYSSIRDIKQWVERISRLHISEQDEHYISLLVEVNHLDIPVNERLIFLESLHQPVPGWQRLFQLFLFQPSVEKY